MQALQALVYSNGNLKLAAERSGLPEATLLQTLYDNFAEFQLQMRAAILLQMFGTWSLVQDALKADLEELDPKDVAKTYTQLSASLASLSEPQAVNNNLNLFESVLMALPEEAREAFRALTAKPTQ